MKLKRRRFIRNLGALLPLVTSPFSKLLAKNPLGLRLEEEDPPGAFKHDFKDSNDRVWIGKDFLSVPMEDWAINKGRLEFNGLERNSRVHVITHILNKGEGDFTLKATLGLLEKKGADGSAGFTVGIQDDTDPESIRAACYFGKGISAGVSLDGKLFIAHQEEAIPASFDYNQFSLKLDVSATSARSRLTLTATDNKKQSVRVTTQHPGELAGLVALENNLFKEGENTFWWKGVELSGNKVIRKAQNRFGPVLWAMYTLSEATLKLTAQFPPVSSEDPSDVELQLFNNGEWKKEQISELHPAAYIAGFTLEKWDATLEVPYRIRYFVDGETHAYEGTIRKEPQNKTLRLGALTCQHGSGYPYRPLVENLEKCNPDLLFFSGDQIYESNGEYPIKRYPEDKAILSYLGKWYMFGWTFGNSMRDRPTICTPDDHDVFQGNLWGEGGERISFEEWEKVRDAHGGFVQTVAMVNVVNLTQCSHLPDPFDPQPLPSGMVTWYTHMNYGRVSFAIISDRYFKSGPEMLREGKGRIDHLTERMNPEALDSNNLSLLGQQQLAFLRKWIGEWQGADMKVLLSQTLFSNVGTHHGSEKKFLFGDLDSGGWPKSQRDEVLRIVRKAWAFHINGDQHLPFIVQYGIDDARDAGWTFCTPAISTGYPRWGQPDLVNIPFSHRPEHHLPNTGTYQDGFGNTNYIYAVGNPEDDFSQIKNRYVRAQMKASGFGLITFDTVERTIKMEAFRFLADMDLQTEANTYPGWPFTINQSDNDGRTPVGYLPELVFRKPNQLLNVIHQETGELVHAIRIKGDRYIPSVFELGQYTLVVGEGETTKTMKEVAISNDPTAIIEV